MLVLVMASCQPKTAVVTSPEYIAEIDAWHAARVEELKGPSGWLNIAGLFWLHDGINAFGTSADNDVIFPPALEAEHAGYFILDKGAVRQSLLPGTLVSRKGKPVGQLETVFNPDSSRQPVMEHGPLRWFIIRRDTKFGVRLRNLEHPNLATFPGIDRFPVDAEWKVVARFEETPGRTIPITNVLGQTTDQAAPGTLVFTLKGKEYRLDALDEGADELFIIFGDATNARQTYGAGRYLYVPLPDSAGQVIVDFNKAENPPCAFTEFATCPLPPIQNVLELSIEAGEKNFGHH